MSIVTGCLIVALVSVALLSYLLQRSRREQAQNVRASRILASIGDGVIVVNSKGESVFANEAGQRMLDSAPDLLHDRSPRSEYFHPVFKQWFEIQSYPNEDDGKTILVRDITASRRLRDALRANEERLASDLQERTSAERRIQCLAEASRILESSLDYEPTFEDLTEFLAKEFCDSCLALVREDFGVRRISAADPGMALGNSDYADAIVQVLDAGVTRRQWSVLGFCAFIPIPTGARTGGVLLLIRQGHAVFEAEDQNLFEEIGRRAGLALEHARLYRSVRELNRLKDEFVAIVSHELRTPLTPILGAVYMLRSESANPHIFERAVNLIERNAKAQAKIVEDLFDVSRIISGKLRMNLEKVDLPTIILAAVDTIRPASEAKNIVLTVSLKPARNTVYGDADRLQQVIWNLLSNSVKFTPSGGEIHVELHESVSYAEVHVVDTGIGIGPEFLPHVFDRFRQADSSRTRSHGGLGLGLAIVQHLVESHGGTVHANSNGEKQGSTFTVRLPVRQSVHATAHAG